MPSVAFASATESASGPGTTAVAVFASTLLSAVQMAPRVPQARPPASITATSSQPSGSMWISRRSLRPSTRRALSTSPPVTSKDSSRSTLKLTRGSRLNRTRNVNGLDPSCASGTPSKLAVSPSGSTGSLAATVSGSASSVAASPIPGCSRSASRPAASRIVPPFKARLSAVTDAADTVPSSAVTA